jgi:hypothetical protein
MAARDGGTLQSVSKGASERASIHLAVRQQRRPDPGADPAPVREGKTEFIPTRVRPETYVFWGAYFQSVSRRSIAVGVTTHFH